MADTDTKQLNVEVVAVDRLVWEGPAKSVVVKTIEGTMGILPGHEPQLARELAATRRLRLDDTGDTELLLGTLCDTFQCDVEPVLLEFHRVKTLSKVPCVAMCCLQHPAKSIGFL